jgi:hypothetical protein
MHTAAGATSRLRRLPKPESWVCLPLTILRSEAVVAAVAVGQALGFAALVGTWLVVAFRPLARSHGAHAADARPTSA